MIAPAISAIFHWRPNQSIHCYLHHKTRCYHRIIRIGNGGESAAKPGGIGFAGAALIKIQYLPPETERIKNRNRIRFSDQWWRLHYHQSVSSNWNSAFQIAASSVNGSRRWILHETTARRNVTCVGVLPRNSSSSGFNLYFASAFRSGCRFGDTWQKRFFQLQPLIEGGGLRFFIGAIRIVFEWKWYSGAIIPS